MRRDMDMGGSIPRVLTATAALLLRVAARCDELPLANLATARWSAWFIWNYKHTFFGCRKAVKMFSKFSTFTKLSSMPAGCDAVNDDGVCIKKQTPWVNLCSSSQILCLIVLIIFAGEKGKLLNVSLHALLLFIHFLCLSLCF